MFCGETNDYNRSRDVPKNINTNIFENAKNTTLSPLATKVRSSMDVLPEYLHMTKEYLKCDILNELRRSFGKLNSPGSIDKAEYDTESVKSKKIFMNSVRKMKFFGLKMRH